MLTPLTSENEPARPESVFEVPDVIADHTLIRCIGEGSYGKVYLAQNQLTGVYRAVKFVFRNAFRDARPYLREFDAICAFEPVSRSHPGFVQVLHVGKLENAFYYIMELADDAALGPSIDPQSYRPRTLGARRGEMLPIEQCIDIGSRLADCLAVLHERKLIHRDIKPSNIIFVNGKPKLADIGLVTQIEEAKSFVGTAGFMPPEGPIAPASDIYSLGKVLYEIATGKDRCEFPQLPADITAENALHLELNQIVLRACDPNPASRYGSAAEFRRELDLLQAGKSIKLLRQVEKRLRFIKLAFAASVLVGLTAFGVYYQIKSKRERAERERQRLAGYLLAEGTSRMRRGHLNEALPYFIRASEYDSSDLRSHQLRIGSVLASAPQVSFAWNGPPHGAFSANGKWLIAPSGKSLVIFETLTGRALKTNTVKDTVNFAKFSRDGGKIAAAAGASLIVLTTEGAEIAEHTFDSAIEDISFSPEGGSIAVALTDATAFFFEPPARRLRPFPQGTSARTMDFGPSGDYLATCNYYGRSYLRNAATGEPRLCLPETDMPYRAVFSPDCKKVVLCGWGGAVPFLTSSGELAGGTMENDDAVRNAAFSPANKIIATANYDGTVRLWDAKTFKPLSLNHILEHQSRPESVIFIDETTLAVHCNDGRNYIWNLGTKTPQSDKIPKLHYPDLLNLQGEDLVLSAKGSTIAGKIGETEVHVKTSDPVSVLAVSPLRNCFATGSKDDRFNITYASLYQLNKLDQPIRLNHKDGINYIAFSNAGDKLVTCSEDFSAIIWDAKTGRRLTQPMRHRWQVAYAAFSSDDRWVATAGWDKAAIIWNAKSGEPLTPPLSFGTPLKYIAFESGNSGIVAGDTTNDFRMNLPLVDLPLKDRDTYMQNWVEPTIVTR